MTGINPAVRKYLRAVGRQLDAPREDRERLMGRLSQAVAAYVEENPEAGAEELAAAFGSPNRCAAELLAECDPDRVAQVRRGKRRQLTAVITVLAVLLVMAAAVFIYFDAYQVDHTVVTVVQYETIPLDPVS